MNILSVIFVLTFGVLMPNQYRCDSVQVNNDIGGFQFELLLAHLADFQSVIEDRYESSLSHITSILERLESRMNALESRMEKRFESSTSQIMTRINQTEAKIDGFESRIERIETSSSQFLDMMRHLHTKVDVLESRMKERYDNSSLIAERLEEKVDIGILNLLHKSPMHRLDKYVQDLGISTLHNPWTTIQQRVNESIGFYRNWKSYKNGFGHQEGEYWIGLEPLYQMTRSAKHELLIVLEDFDGKIKHALYDDFKIGSEDDDYVLIKLGEYSGTVENSFREHVGMPFSTYDRDNDKRPNQNCASQLQGGWWFRIRYTGDCIACNLNGKYYQQPKVHEMQGLNWHGWHGDYYSLKSTKMMIRSRSVPRRTIADQYPRIDKIDKSESSWETSTDYVDATTEF